MIFWWLFPGSDCKALNLPGSFVSPQRWLIYFSLWSPWRTWRCKAEMSSSVNLWVKTRPPPQQERQSEPSPPRDFGSDNSTSGRNRSPWASLLSSSLQSLKRKWLFPSICHSAAALIESGKRESIQKELHFHFHKTCPITAADEPRCKNLIRMSHRGRSVREARL